MKILAFDLSLSCPAFAVIEVKDGVPYVVRLSHKKTNKAKSHAYRLYQIYQHMQDIFALHPDVDELVREKGFSRFPATTQALFKVVGVNDLLANQQGFKEVHELTPTTVKKAITGNGKADKDEVAKGLYAFLGEELDYKTDDESDAVGVGIAYLMKKKALA